jgi:hypothetical protein
MGQVSHGDLRLQDSDVRSSFRGKGGNGGIAVAEDEFAVFSQDEKGPLWRQCFLDLESAKRKAQELAIEEGLEFFVFSLKDSSEVARFFPKPEPGTPRA